MSSPSAVRQHLQNPLRVIGWLLLGELLSTKAVGVAMWLATGSGFWPLATGIRDGRVKMHAGQTTVVRQIQQLQRLETVRYTMDKIISGERDNPYLPKFLVSDRLLLMVHSEVIGGVDFSELQANHVAVHGRKVTLHLPKAVILVTRLDSAKTHVYSRDTGLFSSPVSPTPTPTHRKSANYGRDTVPIHGSQYVQSRIPPLAT
jgi:hypothetical protein